MILISFPFPYSTQVTLLRAMERDENILISLDFREEHSDSRVSQGLIKQSYFVYIELNGSMC